MKLVKLLRPPKSYFAREIKETESWIFFNPLNDDRRVESRLTQESLKRKKSYMETKFDLISRLNHLHHIHPSSPSSQLSHGLMKTINALS